MLVIITDGIMSDVRDTIDALIEVSDLPLYVIIGTPFAIHVHLPLSIAIQRADAVTTMH